MSDKTEEDMEVRHARCGGGRCQLIVPPGSEEMDGWMLRTPGPHESSSRLRTREARVNWSDEHLTPGLQAGREGDRGKPWLGWDSGWVGMRCD